MLDLENWTDVQIREKFQELGSPVGPVTSTTRRIMLKRLKILLSNEGKSASPVEDVADTWEDEPDVAPFPTSRIPKRLGRSALAALNESQSPRAPPVTSPNRNSFNEVSSSTETRTKSPSRKSVGRAANVSFSTTEPVDEYQPPPRKTTPGRKAAESPSRGEGWAQRELLEIRESLDRTLPSHGLASNETFRSRLHFEPSHSGGGEYRRNVSRTSSTWHDEDDVLSEDEENISSPVLVVRGNKPFGYELRRGGRGASSSICTPLVAVATAVTLLIAVALGGSFALYQGRAVDSRFPVSDWVFPVCTGSHTDRTRINCIPKEDEEVVLSMASVAIDGLDGIRQAAACSTSPSSPVFVDNAALKELIVASDRAFSAWLCEKTLPSLKIMFDANSHLAIRTKPMGVALLSAPDTFVCFLWSNTVFLAEWIVRIGSVGVAAALLYTAVSWYLTRLQKQREDVSSALDKLLDLARTRKFVTLALTREELAHCFGPAVIAEALKKAEEDNCVRIETRNNVEGIRWIGDDRSALESPWGNSLCTPTEVNSYVVPPTSCLKIRGLSLPTKKVLSDEDIVKIVDDVLERSIGNRIVHIGIDRKSEEGIAYLRGLTKADAGGVFRRLNGSFYNGQQVVVKYIREPRYDEKFPDTASQTRPLRPSTRL